jgi:hypothetical protein
MNTETELQEELISEISRRNDCKIKSDVSFKTIWLHDEGYETEFRYAIFMKKVIISRVCFNHRHAGSMTACLEILKKYAKKLDYDIIAIQCVETFEMMNWCNKNNFMPSSYSMNITDKKGRVVRIGDYEYNIA